MQEEQVLSKTKSFSCNEMWCTGDVFSFVLGTPLDARTNRKCHNNWLRKNICIGCNFHHEINKTTLKIVDNNVLI